MADCAIRLGEGNLDKAIENYQASLVKEVPAAEKIDVLDSPADRVMHELLDHDGRGLGLVEAQLEHGARVRERVAEHQRADLECDRVFVAAVDDPGHVAGATQPPRGARAGRLTGGDGK